MSNVKPKSKASFIAAGIFLFLGNIFFFLTLWLLRKYDKVFVDQIVFTMKASNAGVHRAILDSALIRVLLFSIIAVSLEILGYLILSGKGGKLLKRFEKYKAYIETKICNFFQTRALLISVVIFIAGLSFFLIRMNVFTYIKTALEESTFIEENYAQPEEVKITFPENKRNLIYIFLESMENTFAETDAGKSIETDYIPELSQLARENINFSNTEDLGGAKALNGTTWTVAAMVSQTSSIPIKVPFDAECYGKNGEFIPGVISIGEILEKEGYNQTLLFGADANFHGRKQYFTTHGNYKIVDTISLKNDGRLEKDYRVWWGFEDKKLFEYAKEELAELASQDKPFNLTMITADTHFPDGYVCEICNNVYDRQYANVLSCASKQVYDFITWVKQQPFYENTTVIISGDHLTMDAEFLTEMNESYERTTYNCILNSPAKPKKEKNRQFSSFDMFPTTLAAIGAEIDGDRLGLGTNLFSSEETLVEKYGVDFLDDEILKQSKFYNEFFLYMEE